MTFHQRITRRHADCKAVQGEASELLEQCETAVEPDEKLSSLLDDAEQYLGMAVRAIGRAEKHAREAGDGQ